MSAMNIKRQARIKRKKRIRKKISGTPERPRFSVFRSAKHIYAQIVDDTKGVVIVSASTMEKSIRDKNDFDNKVSAAEFIGKLAGERAIEKGISKVVFDRNGFLYHGRVKAISDGARKAGLNF